LILPPPPFVGKVQYSICICVRGVFGAGGWNGLVRCRLGVYVDQFGVLC
jgi:hypothetical protein